LVEAQQLTDANHFSALRLMAGGHRVRSKERIPM
jgi:hypothetical protein